ncbi:5-methyltetrahydropteroyltriglutamate--homocysteine methyltransferase [Vibrio xiamenensis]|uniref:5-methyltetrahydropteroyltriglutamate--homocysteine methyltransferase n=1 Tax=Vibrio xiamenensis TaxID=861298 RepID=A0A1G7YXQ2_9VIBR|nr:5-methyltetrahydropteroyltriglutamate--homocysteine S-methyltransferase [Vibrio xiamenensis]SDH01283.1 5-methyltetrahydropteroyltriglutamate--homocysteine methyltransferase [Vibrio xiamenensis]
MAIRPPFRSDVVGSYLRPSHLHQARRDYANGIISQEALLDTYTTAVKELVAEQKKAGLKVITDGEFCRGFWHIDFLEHLNGIEGYTPEAYNQKFSGKAAPAYNIRLTGKVSFNPQHPFLRDFSILKTLAETGDGCVAKATIPSPTMVLRQEVLANDGSSKINQIYPDLNEFYQDLAETYRQAIQAFYAIGCRYLQFDDTNWAFLIDAEKRQQLLEKGIDPQKTAQICTDILNSALEGKPEDMVITTHICRGNHASSWLFSGGYEAVAKELFATKFDGYFLEYDSDRSGSFEPLRHWNNKNSKVVLGLVTSKFAELEDKETIKARIKEASQYVPLENLCLSPQCGFASTEEGNKLTVEEQWNKIRLIEEIASEVWD